MDLALAAQLSVVGFVVSVLLMEQGQLLSWYDDWLDGVEDKLPWLSHPLGKCERCFTGQLSFWFYVWTNYPNCNPVKLVIFTSFSIFFVYLIKELAQLWR
mgnify:FL=1